MTKIFGQDDDIVSDLEDIQAEVDNLDGDAMRGTDSALPAASYTAERGTDNALLAANYATERGTDNAALASVWTAVLATALANYTASRAGYIDELNATNIPADIGENDDGHDGNTLFGRLQQIIEHIHTAQNVYPSEADGVTLTTAAGDWALGTITEIVPADTITNGFDIHEILIEDVNTQDKTYELVLYYGADDTECARVRFAASSTKGGVPAQFAMTPLLAANSRIRAKLAIQDGSGKTAKISLRYHEY